MGSGRFARPSLWDNTVAMLMMTEIRARTRFSDWPLALKSILGFWLFYAATVVARAFLGTDPTTTLINKLSVISIGIVVTGLIYLAIASIGFGHTIRRRAITAAAASFRPPRSTSSCRRPFPTAHTTPRSCCQSRE